MRGYAAALFGLLMNLVLPVSMAMAAQFSGGQFETSLCSATGIRPVVFLESTTYSNLEADREHDLCSYCSIHNGTALPIPAASGERADLTGLQGPLWPASGAEPPALRLIDASVIHQDNLIAAVNRIGRGTDFIKESGNIFFLIEKRNDD